MSKGEIISIKVGFDLDTIVADKVMDYGVAKEGEYYPHIYNKKDSCLWDKKIGLLPSYSTNISDAWKVIEKLMSLGWRYTVNYLDDFRFPDGVHHCCFSKLRPECNEYKHTYGEFEDSKRISVRGYGETPSEAICKAALCALIGKEEN